MNLYNDNDRYVCEWLRNLVAAGAIPPGDVLERSILDIEPADLTGYRQVHFFAGIAGWAHALALAGVHHDTPLWTGSPPCQPFSAAGAMKGTDDARHLAPQWLGLIRACRPPLIFGEQVASALVVGRSAAPPAAGADDRPYAWFDDLQAHLEGSSYAVGAADMPAASVGAPHIRQRLWFVAERMGDAGAAGLPARERAAVVGAGRREEGRAVEQPGRPPVGLGHADGANAAQERARDDEFRSQRQAVGGWAVEQPRAGATSGDGGGDRTKRVARAGDGGHTRPTRRVGLDDGRRPGAPDEFWRDADWLFCTDGKWRPAGPGSFPLAHGVPNRVGRLRAYGNSIVPQVAARFIVACLNS